MVELNSSEPMIAGFWRRSAAFFVDGFIMVAITMGLGFAFFGFFSGLTQFAGRIISALIPLFYFGLLESRLGGGCSLGKRLLRIKVVSQHGQLISPIRSLFRSFIFWLPFCLNGLVLPFDAPAVIAKAYLIFFMLVLLLGLFGSFYLFLFNVRTRQLMQDLFCQTYVVNKASDQTTMPKIWKGHFIVLVICLVLLMGLALFILSKVKNEWNQLDITHQDKRLQAIVKILETRKDVVESTPQLMTQTLPFGRKTLTLNVFVRLNHPVSYQDIFDLYPLIKKSLVDLPLDSGVTITADHGFTMMFASINHPRSVSKSLTNWDRFLKALRDIPEVKKLAAQGSPMNQYDLGAFYLQEMPGEKDQEAVEFIQKAAAQHYVPAMSDLAVFYAMGKGGLKQDYKISFSYALQAAQKGDRAAMFNVGLRYYYGAGIEQNYQEAYRWFQQAAVKSYHAQFMLAMMFAKGLGVTQNKVTAVSWLLDAVQPYFAAIVSDPEQRQQLVGAFVKYQMALFEGKADAISTIQDPNVAKMFRFVTDSFQKACSIGQGSYVPY